MPNKLKIEDVISRLPRFLKITPETYKGIRYSAEFIDIDYDEKFVANVSSVITLQHGCKSRSNDLRSKTNKEKFKGKQGGKQSIIDIDEVKSKLPYFLKIDESTYSGVRYKAKFYDTEYDTWFEAMPANMMRGKGYCKQRQYDNNKIKGIIPIEEVQRRLAENFGDEYVIIPETYKSSREYAYFLMKDGSKVRYIVDRVVSGRVKYRKELERWKTKIFVRDDWTCQRCGSINKTQAHHIKTFHSHPECRFDPDNGCTLCKDCHDLYHSIYKNEETVENFNLFLVQYSTP